MSDAREWLTDLTHDSSVVDAAKMRSALLAVLDAHQRYDSAHGSWCFACDGGVRIVPWPCETVQIINEALFGNDRTPNSLSEKWCAVCTWEGTFKAGIHYCVRCGRPVRIG